MSLLALACAHTQASRQRRRRPCGSAAGARRHPSARCQLDLSDQIAYRPPASASPLLTRGSLSPPGAVRIALRYISSALASRRSDSRHQTECLETSFAAIIFFLRDGVTPIPSVGATCFFRHCSCAIFNGSTTTMCCAKLMIGNAGQYSKLDVAHVISGAAGGGCYFAGTPAPAG